MSYLQRWRDGARFIGLSAEGGLRPGVHAGLAAVWNPLGQPGSPGSCRCFGRSRVNAADTPDLTAKTTRAPSPHTRRETPGRIPAPPERGVNAPKEPVRRLHRSKLLQGTAAAVIPMGFRRATQGCRAVATLGAKRQTRATPKGLCSGTTRRATVSQALMAASVIAALAAPARGQDRETIQITLHPVAAAQPALKYQLLPPFLDRRPGNAALQYLKVPHEQSQLFSNREFWDTITKWAEMPLGDLRRELTTAKGKWYRRMVSGPDVIIQDLERGAHCESCDWDIPIREQPYWFVPLPEIQSQRAPDRLLAARARLQIAGGKYDEALKTLQTGYAFGRHVGRGVCLVQELVGWRIVEHMSKQLETLIQQPGAPNLYWALATLPRPLVDVRPALEAEAASVYLTFPELRDLDQKNYPPPQWRQLLEKILGMIAQYHQGPHAAKSRTVPFEITAALAAGYPRAKRFLIAHGRSAGEVEAMPVAQVVLLYTMHTYDELCDNTLKWALIPYSQGRKGLAQAEQQNLEGFRSGREIVPVAENFAPAVQAVMSAQAKVERNLAALQILEAIRIYGAAHNAQLPAKLEDITEVPIPEDPWRGEPFLYHREGGTAILESPDPRYASPYGLRYQIHFAQKGKSP